MPLFFLELLVVLNLKNFLAAVIAASLTSTVAQNNLAALGALCHAGESELPVVRTSLRKENFSNSNSIKNVSIGRYIL